MYMNTIFYMYATILNLKLKNFYVLKEVSSA